MAFGGFEQSNDAPMAEINVIPLVDIMLVLLVIFIITAPVLTHAVKIELPQASSERNEETPETVTVAIDAEGQLFWNDAPVSEEELPARLRAAAEADPELQLHLRADRLTTYDLLARVMAAAQGSGVSRIGFVSEPERP
jgi:biopolymer transport protein ExbD